MLGTDYRNGITRYEICIWCRHLTLILLSDPRFFEKLERFPKVTGCVCVCMYLTSGGQRHVAPALGEPIGL